MCKKKCVWLERKKIFLWEPFFNPKHSQYYGNHDNLLTLNKYLNHINPEMHETQDVNVSPMLLMLMNSMQWKGKKLTLNVIFAETTIRSYLTHSK